MAKINNIFMLSYFIINLANAQAQNINFEKISLEQGLSQSNVTQIVQDQQGFLWFGTTSGLNRYDGYNFKVYYASAGDSNSLCNNNISCMLVDRKNILWIGTFDGLNAYDIKNDTFTHFRNDPKNPTSISDNRIRDIYEDRKGNIWICTNNGLDKYDKKKSAFIRYYNSDQIPDNFYNIVCCVIEDDENNILFGTYNGLYVISTADHNKDNLNSTHFKSSNFRRVPTPKDSRGVDGVKLEIDGQGNLTRVEIFCGQHCPGSSTRTVDMNLAVNDETGDDVRLVDDGTTGAALLSAIEVSSEQKVIIQFWPVSKNNWTSLITCMASSVIRSSLAGLQDIEKYKLRGGLDCLLGDDDDADKDGDDPLMFGIKHMNSML